MAGQVNIRLEVHQLTVREAADLLDVLQRGWKIHAIDIVMDGETEIPSPLVFAATGTDYDSFPLDIPPDELPRLFNEVAAANPFLAATIKKRLQQGVAAMEQVQEDLLRQIEQIEAEAEETASEK